MNNINNIQDNLSPSQNTKKKAFKAMMILATLGNSIFMFGLLAILINGLKFADLASYFSDPFVLAFLFISGIPFLGIFMLILPLSILAVSSVRRRDFAKQFGFYYLIAIAVTLTLWLLAYYLYKFYL